MKGEIGRWSVNILLFRGGSVDGLGFALNDAALCCSFGCHLCTWVGGVVIPNMQTYFIGLESCFVGLSARALTNGVDTTKH